MQYSLSCYDQYLCLRPSALMWIALLYLSRALALPLLAPLASFAGVDVDPEMMSRLTHGLSPYALVAAMPSFLVLVSLLRRSPRSRSPVRWTLAHGRGLLIGGAILNVSLTLAAASGFGQRTLSPAVFFSATPDLFFLVYVASDQRVRDVLRSVPAELPPVSPRA